MNEENIIEVDHYNSAYLEEYNGTYWLYALVKGSGQQAVWYKLWVFLSKYNKGNPIPDDMKRPMAVRLGDKKTAVKVLRELLKQVEG